MNNTLISMYAKQKVKESISEFYDFVFTLLNNLIDTNLDDNLKLVFINHLMFEKNLVFFEDEDTYKDSTTSGKYLQIGVISQVLTKDNNLMPVDIMARTLNGKRKKLTKENYVIMYNPIPTSYMKMKIDEISDIENITKFVRQLYKVPVVFSAKDSKAVKAIKDFLKDLFSIKEICVVANDSWEVGKKLESINLNIPYITDKLLDETESLKEDILEIFGIYKNTSGNRERVNETELIISNSMTTVNKLGIEKTFEKTFKKVNEKFNLKDKIVLELNINKIFDITKESESDKK